MYKYFWSIHWDTGIYCRYSAVYSVQHQERSINEDTVIKVTLNPLILRRPISVHVKGEMPKISLHSGHSGNPSI